MGKLLGMVFILLCVYGAYPYATLWRIQTAIQQRDEVTLNALVDWPRLRESVKSVVASELTQRALNEIPGASDTGMSALGTAVGSALGMKLLETYLDSFISASGAVRLFAKSGRSG